MVEKRTRRRFTAEFKTQAVERLLEGGRGLLEVATERGLSPGQLSQCRNERLAAGSAVALAVCPHDLRHGLATQAARDGASALLIRDLLGHKTLSMANRYVAKVAEEAQAAQRRAGAAVGAALMPSSEAAAEMIELQRPSRA